MSAVGVPVDGQAFVHLLFLASQRGVLVRGPVIAGELAFVSAADWLGPPPAAPDREAALSKLARRYLAGHGPATDRDLAKWAGVGLRDVRRGLATHHSAAAIDQDEDGLLRLRAGLTPIEPAPPRLLGAFDPLLHGWVSKEPVLGGHTSVVTRNGVFRPVVLVDGRAAGTWTLRKAAVQLQPFDRLDENTLGRLDAEAADVIRFLG